MSKSLNSSSMPVDAADDAPAASSSSALWTTLYRPRLAWIVVPSCLYFLALFVTVPIAVQVLVAVVCESMQEEDCNSSRVSSRASVINLYFSLCATVPSFLLSGLYGSVADVYGRKICILIPFFGYLGYTCALLYVDAYRPAYYLPLFLGSALLVGLTGSFAAFQMAVFSYAADITQRNAVTRSRRGVVYSLLESCLFFAKIVGPLSAGLWAQAYGFRVPLGVAVFLCCAGIAWSIAMPESLPPTAASRRSPVEFDPFKTLRNLWLITAEGGWTSPVPFLSAAFLLYFASYMGNQQISLLYVKHRFGWSPQIIGYYDSTEGIVQMLSMVAVPWLITRALGRYVDQWWLLVGYLFRAAHFFLYGMAQNTQTIFAIAVLLIFCGPLTPRTRSIISNAASAKMQASVLSAFSALQSLAQFAAPGFSAGYSVTVFACPGAMYFVLGALTLTSAGIMVWVIAMGLLPIGGAGRPLSKAERMERRALSPIGEEDEDGEGDEEDFEERGKGGRTEGKTGEDDEGDEGDDDEGGGEVCIGLSVGGSGAQGGVDGYDSLSSLLPIQHAFSSSPGRASPDQGQGSSLTRRLLAER